MDLEENKSKKVQIILPVLLSVVTLLVLIVGATFAYINVTTQLNFGTLNVKSSVPQTGMVTMSKGSDLTMQLTRPQLMKESPNTYYASSGGVTTTATTATIATASVSGDAAGTYECTYTINVKGNPYTMATNSIGKGEGLFVLTLNYYSENGSDTVKSWDFNTAQNDINSNNGWSFSGKITGIKQSTPKSMSAQLKFVNSKDADQTDLNNTSATFSFQITAFNCKATA